MNNIKELTSQLPIYIPEEILFRILFEMNKYFEKDFTKAVQNLQKETKRVFNTVQRKILRKYFYYSDSNILKEICISKFDSINPNDSDKNDVLSKTINRLRIYDSKKILNSIIERYQKIKSGKLGSDNSKLWLQYYSEKVSKEFDYSVAIIRVTQDEFALNEYNVSYLYNRIAKLYQKLENYRHFVIIFDQDLIDKQGNILTWSIMFKISIYCENFMQFTDKYFPFKKEQRINELKDFIFSRTGFEQSLDFAKQFYNSISYGFKFEDCFISESVSKKILVFKKISLDSRHVPCPSCLTTIQSSNSYPEVFLQSWECKNPNCPDRSKSGRGKRFDEFGTYRYFKVSENNPNNTIDFDLYKTWKRDIFPNTSDILEMIIKYYSWAGEKIACDFDIGNKYNSLNRTIVKYNFDSLPFPESCVSSYSSLPLIVLLSSINEKLIFKNGNKKFEQQIIPINANSTCFLQSINKNTVGSAITSPPYYNAREYSQWPTLVLYLIDMMANAKAVFNVIDDNGTYLYNIGDIVSEDNVYVKSNMSKRRLQLGFLSSAIFEIVGFKLTGNIIWDKGEVQSKRNSTVNLNAGYVRCINCYEHVLVFQKNYSRKAYDYVARFNPVIKINCKGENIYKHTAPYPLEMIELLRPFIIKNKYILDPFLGSGTTLVWCKANNFKGLGIELNEEYYKLCLENIEK